MFSFSDAFKQSTKGHNYNTAVILIHKEILPTKQNCCYIYISTASECIFKVESMQKRNIIQF